jgi:hypothetical protein
MTPREYANIPTRRLFISALFHPNLSPTTRRERLRTAIHRNGRVLPIDGVAVPTLPKRVREIIWLVAYRHGIPPELFWVRTRIHKISHARQEAMRRVFEEYKLASMSRIGRWFGVDHSTVKYAIEKGCGEPVDSGLGSRAQESVAA